MQPTASCQSAVLLLTTHISRMSSELPRGYPTRSRARHRRSPSNPPGHGRHERLHARGQVHPNLSRMLGCMHALLLAGATTQLTDVHGGTTPQWAEVQGQPTTLELIQQHAAPLQHTAWPAAPPDAGEPVMSSAPRCPSRCTCRPSEASCRRWPAGCTREGRSMRSTLTFQLKAAGPQPSVYYTPPHATANWRS